MQHGIMRIIITKHIIFSLVTRGTLTAVFSVTFTSIFGFSYLSGEVETT